MGRLVWEIGIKRPIKILSFRAYNINGFKGLFVCLLNFITHGLVLHYRLSNNTSHII